MNVSFYNIVIRFKNQIRILNLTKWTEDSISTISSEAPTTNHKPTIKNTNHIKL